MKLPTLTIDTQPLRWLALISAILGVAALIAAIRVPMHSIAYLNIGGILLSLVGGVFIASGVALNREQVATLKANYKPKKWLQKTTDLALEASRVVTIGVIYLVIGAIYQVASSYLSSG